MSVPEKQKKTKLVFLEERCKGCGLCVATCPRKLLVVGEKINNQGYHVAELIDSEKCNSCALCAEMCPDVVIEVWK